MFPSRVASAILADVEPWLPARRNRGGTCRDDARHRRAQGFSGRQDAALSGRRDARRHLSKSFSPLRMRGNARSGRKLAGAAQVVFGPALDAGMIGCGTGNPSARVSRGMSSFATRPVQPVWCEAPRPRPLSPSKYSWNKT